MPMQIQRKLICCKLPFLHDQLHEQLLFPKAFGKPWSSDLQCFRCFVYCFLVPQLTDALKKNTELADIAGEENIKVIVERFR